jgi:hypothetical protein
MQLKDEFRTYDSLRREHDAQIVQIATEAGLRIAPDQWSSLLYGDSAHKSHMQSIIDKLQTPQSFGQSVQELVIALQRTGDPHNLSNLRPSLELLAALDPCPDATVPSWAECDGALEAARRPIQRSTIRAVRPRITWHQVQNQFMSRSSSWWMPAWIQLHVCTLRRGARQVPISSPKEFRQTEKRNWRRRKFRFSGKFGGGRRRCRYCNDHRD